METKISNQEITNFVNYCLSFYGQNSIYADELKGGATKEMMRKSVKIYLMTLNDKRTWGGGDSLDRERVKYILDMFLF